MIEEVIRETVNNFDFSLVIVINVATYIIIKIIDEFNGSKRVTTWGKRGIFLLCSIIIGWVYYLIGVPPKLIINSIIIAPISWSWIFKPICKHYGIDYKKFSQY